MAQHIIFQRKTPWHAAGPQLNPQLFHVLNKFWPLADSYFLWSIVRFASFRRLVGLRRVDRGYTHPCIARMNRMRSQFFCSFCEVQHRVGRDEVMIALSLTYIWHIAELMTVPQNGYCTIPRMARDSLCLCIIRPP